MTEKKTWGYEEGLKADGVVPTDEHVDLGIQYSTSLRDGEYYIEMHLKDGREVHVDGDRLVIGPKPGKENVPDQEGWKTDGTYPAGKEIYLWYEGISGDGLYAIFDGYNVLIYTR